MRLEKNPEGIGELTLTTPEEERALNARNVFAYLSGHGEGGRRWLGEQFEGRIEPYLAFSRARQGADPWGMAEEFFRGRMEYPTAEAARQLGAAQQRSHPLPDTFEGRLL
ncbi:MAG: hypothetical protein HY520_02420 [Candidatus Aenigmarchaeota archaeon]|nr:hypothetical protein [Candidatus Aenigmarchaeota archaeon]